ncbi:uncharacterized protein LOC135481777 [Liolophura sinensis]|uniref:uncharacterized protein LOC135481777 n=1 Tax=Liolophura sinensis TaxID=3198878 RepID=UPI0031595BFF
MSKKAQRLESKKRKAVAFLQLVQDKEKTKDTTCCTPDKQARTEEVSNHGNKSAEMDEETRARIRAVREWKKASMERPKLYLTLDDLDDDGVRPPLFVQDLQHLILFGLEGNITSFKPRWCKLLRCTKVSGVVVVVLNDVGQSDYEAYKDSFSHLDALFDMCISLTSPSQYGSTVDQEMFNLPVSISELLRRNVPLKNAKEISYGATPQYIQKLITINHKIAELPDEDVFPRTHLLLSSSQMSAEKYPLPLESQSDKLKDFVFTCDKYEEVTASSPMFAVDCEMCKTSEKTSELTWVSLVNEDLEVLYETLVKPYTRITNYLTRYSGVSEKMLSTITTRLEDVQRHIQKILPPDAILCGQSLNADLMALRMFHPYVIDTSVIYNLTGLSNVKPSLRKLSSIFLGKLIQDGQSGHNPSEDAIATMELVKLKLRQGLHYGDVRMGNINFPQQVSRQPDQQDASEGCGTTAKTAAVEDESNGCQNTSEKSNQISETVNRESEKTVTTKSAVPSDSHHTKSIPDIPHMIEKRKNFFEHLGYNFNNSFFEKLKKCNKKAAMIDCAEVLERYKVIDETLQRVETSSDKTSKSEAKECVKSKEFVWTQLHAYNRLLESNTNITDEDRMSCLKKLDRRMSKILRAVSPNSVCVVVMTGRTDGNTVNNAMGFVRIKI